MQPAALDRFQDIPRMKPSRDIHTLIQIMARLRTPESGCPWDIEQTFASIAPYTIEEAYEVADAIGRGDLDRGLPDELGDLLLQVVFHARMAEEQGRFDFGDVVKAITEKLIRRHPHVFADAGKLAPDQVKELWHEIKAQERAERGDTDQKRALDGIPLALPALTRAQKRQEKAACVGFDWSEARDVLAKIAEEAREIEPVLEDPEAAAEEIGDLIFAAVNLARHAKVDAEAALRAASIKFERRFCSIEDALAAQGRTPADATLDEMEVLWNEAKVRERKA
jgi:nucleoside triphosphate diphosphatase